MYLLLLNVIAVKMYSNPLFCLLFFCKIVSCRDFYAGLFRTNDFLVAQDRVYKEKVMFQYTVAKYGRYFKCPISYFRVVDRLGIGGGPHVEVTRGGLRHKYLSLRLTSPYNLPISVNIYVGCENKNGKRTRPRKKKTTCEIPTKVKKLFGIDGPVGTPQQHWLCCYFT
ncbi:hypothetical protein MSG28_004796 [Choristoneura fumiferana]|uniref:Uncharacterized protein n=1 Tax=Choristoneura fumiferana TaxID=7141 RepID=A0ACC0K850_CHOFU|nr:hypothetical protein MSG28_004796 [Choristoneura fumiferana]